MKTDFIIQKMMEYYNALTMKELAQKIGISQQAISKWKINNSITAIKKKCRELNIYNEIFGASSSLSNEKKVSNGDLSEYFIAL